MTPKPSHTAEPWSCHMLGGGKGGPNKYSVRASGDNGESGYGIAIFQPFCGSAGPNARRAVACVNALAGIRNPAAVKELIETILQIRGDGHISVEVLDCLDVYLAALDQEPKP